MPESPKQKVYCYVDETGQDTKGGLFLVALVVIDEQRDVLAAEAELIEERTGKGIAKWRKSCFWQEGPIYFRLFRHYPFSGRQCGAGCGRIERLRGSPKETVVTALALLRSFLPGFTRNRTSLK